MSVKYRLIKINLYFSLTNVPLYQHVDRVKTNFTAFNLYGLLLERQKLYKNSAKAFETAVHLLKDSRQKEELRKAKLNLARVLM